MKFFVATAVVMLLGVAACRAAPPIQTAPAALPAAAQADEREAIAKIVRAEGQAVVAKDINRLAQLWTDDATVTDAKHTPGDPKDDAVWRGVDAVLDRYMVVVFPGNPQVAEPGDIQIEINGDTAEARSTTHIGNEISPGGDLWTFRRQGGRWLIAGLTYNLEGK